jgi:hypothetical protein
MKYKNNCEERDEIKEEVMADLKQIIYVEELRNIMRTSGQPILARTQTN